MSRLSVTCAESIHRRHVLYFFFSIRLSISFQRNPDRKNEGKRGGSESTSTIISCSSQLGHTTPAPSKKYTMNFIKDLSVDKVLNLAEDTFNQVKPKTDVEARVYEVLSHKNWGSSSTIMNQIAQDTYDYDKCESDLFERVHMRWVASSIVGNSTSWEIRGRSLYITDECRLRCVVRAPPSHGHCPLNASMPMVHKSHPFIYFLSFSPNKTFPPKMQSRSSPASCGRPWKPSVLPRGASSSRA